MITLRIAQSFTLLPLETAINRGPPIRFHIGVVVNALGVSRIKMCCPIPHVVGVTLNNALGLANNNLFSFAVMGRVLSNFSVRLSKFYPFSFVSMDHFVIMIYR